MTTLQRELGHGRRDARTCPCRCEVSDHAGIRTLSNPAYQRHPSELEGRIWARFGLVRHGTRLPPQTAPVRERNQPSPCDCDVVVKPEPLWLSRRSALLTGIAVGLAATAVAVVVVYLDPRENDTWLNLSIGVVVLAAPLATVTALTRQRLLMAVWTWITIGLPGAYVFGTPVFLTSVSLAVALATDALVSGRFASCSGRAVHAHVPERPQ